MAETSVVQDVQQTPSPANVLSNLTSDQRAEWRKTGELPKAEEKKAEVTEQEEVSDATEEVAETSTASEAGKSQESKPRHNAETRIRDLNAKLKAALAEVEQLKKPKAVEETKKAESSPAKVDEFKAPVKPKQADYDGSPGKTWEDYEEARDKYFEDLAEYKAESKARQLKAEQAQQAEVQKTADSLKEARTRYKDWDEVAKPIVEGFSSKDVHPEVLKTLNSMKNLPDVLYTIGGDAEAVQSLVEAAQKDPIQAIRRLSVYEYLVAQELSKGEAKETKTSETPVTKAPKPVTEVGGRGAATEDPSLAAVRANDFRATKALWDRQAREGK